MKLKYSLAFVIGIFLVSCTEESSHTTNISEQFSPNWIQLPAKEGPSVENEFSVTEYVNVLNGGQLIIDQSYNGGPHEVVDIYAKLTIYPNTVVQPVNITMTIDDINGTINFTPSTIFLNPSELYVKLEGLDLYNINPQDISFVTVVNGNIYDIFSEILTIDVANGIIELRVPEFVVDNPQILQNVTINPDSRYGWVRRAD